MTRQSITLAEKNDEWLKAQVAAQEFNSKSEVVNYLIKKARDQKEYDDYVQIKINRALKSGRAAKQSREEMLVEFKERIKNV